MQTFPKFVLNDSFSARYGIGNLAIPKNTNCPMEKIINECFFSKCRYFKIKLLNIVTRMFLFSFGPSNSTYLWLRGDTVQETAIFA